MRPARSYAASAAAAAPPAARGASPAPRPSSPSTPPGGRRAAPRPGRRGPWSQNPPPLPGCTNARHNYGLTEKNDIPLGISTVQAKYSLKCHICAKRRE